MKNNFTNTKKKKQRMILLLVILAVTIGFAALATTLKINGFSLIGKNTWDIRWDEESVTMSEEMPADMEEEEKPKVSKSTTTDDTVSFTANLNLPGDFYEFYIDAINKGTINGEIASVTTTWKKNGEVTTLPDFLTYTVIYADNGEEPKPGDVLLKGESRTYFVRLEYNEDAEVLPEDAVIYSAEIAIDYRQGEDTVAPTNNPSYSFLQGISGTLPDITSTPDDPTPTVSNPIKITTPTVTPSDPTDPTTPTLEASEDIRYLSDDPSNYIYFNCESLAQQDDDNCELWRLIGTDSKIGNRMKIIKDEPLTDSTTGEYITKAWNDTSDQTLTADWENSSLKEYLNGEYYDSLTDVSKQLIPEVKWYTGYTEEPIDTSGSLYNYERTSHPTTSGTSGASQTATKIFPKSGAKTANDVKRNNVMAKVGLMYASDYGYSSSVCSSSCIATNSNPNGQPCRNYDPTAHGAPEGTPYVSDIEGFLSDYGSEKCAGTSWLYSGFDEWTLTAGKYITALYIDSSGNLGTTLVNKTTYDVEGGKFITGKAWGALKIRPVVYLKSGVSITGKGSRANPYKIVASNEVLAGEDIYVEPEPEPDPTPSNENVLASHVNPSCSDTTAPTCELTYVNVLSNGFAFAFNCTDDIEINRITSLFDADPFHGDYDSKSFSRIGTIKNGTVINGGKTKTYSGRWTTNASHKPNRHTCYYFSYGGEDKCGNWVVYHTPSCYQF